MNVQENITATIVQASPTTVADAVMAVAHPSKAYDQHGRITSAGNNLPVFAVGDHFYIQGGGWVNDANYGPYRVDEVVVANSEIIVSKLDKGSVFIAESSVSVNIVISKGLIKLEAANPTLYVLANAGAFSVTVEMSTNGKNFVTSGLTAIVALGATNLAKRTIWANVVVGTIGTSVTWGWAFQRIQS